MKNMGSFIPQDYCFGKVVKTIFIIITGILLVYRGIYPFRKSYGISDVVTGKIIALVLE